MASKPRGVRQAQDDLVNEIRRLLDLADPQVGILNKGLGSDGTITVVMAPDHVYEVTVKPVRSTFPRM